MLSVWLWWERFSAWRQRIRPVTEGSVLRYSLPSYRGRRTVLADGTPVEPGDRVVELHLDNRRLVELSAASAGPWALLRRVKADLARLQSLLEAGQLGQAVAIHGVSLFAGAAPRLGFEVRSRPRTWHARLERFFMAGLVVLYHPGGWEAARTQADRWPEEAWISRTALAARYGTRRRPAG